MAALLLVFPFGLLFIAFIAVCLHTGTAWPWNHVVHEDGQRTLLGTIFYFEHALRELPLDLILGAAVAGGFRYFYPLTSSANAGLLERLSRRAAVAAVLVMAVILAGAAIVDGMPVVVNNLAQMHTRPGNPLVFGSHWRYHFLERLAMIFFAFACVGACRNYTRLAAGNGNLSLYGGSLALFVLLTLVFGLSYEPFREPIFLGHQARELVTHLSVSLPLAVGACLWAAGLVLPGTMRSRAPGETWSPYVAATCGGLIGLYLVAGALWTGASSQGQTKSLVPLIFGHYFEHSFTYLLTPLVAVSLYLNRQWSVVKSESAMVKSWLR